MCSRLRPCLVQLICLAVWLFSFLLSIPDWMYLMASSNSEQEDKNECLYGYSSKETRLATRLSYHVLGFLLPVVTLLYCFTCVLLQCKSENNVLKQRPMQVFIFLVLVFFISWMPYNIALLVDTFLPHFTSTESTEPCKKIRWTALKSTAVLGLLHSCLNPLIYLGFSEKFRHWMLNIVKCSSCAVDNYDFFLWNSRKIYNATPVPQEENMSLQPVTIINQQDEKIL